MQSINIGGVFAGAVLKSKNFMVISKQTYCYINFLTRGTLFLLLVCSLLSGFEGHPNPDIWGEGILPDSLMLERFPPDDTHPSLFLDGTMQKRADEDDLEKLNWVPLGQPWGGTATGLMRGFDNDFICWNEQSGYYRTTDSVMVWKPFTVNLPDWMASMRQDDQYYYYMANQFLYRSNDAETWEYLKLLPNNNLSILKTGELINLSDEGILYSEDRGITWGQIEAPVSNFRSISVFRHSGKVYYVLESHDRHDTQLFGRSGWEGPWEPSVDLDSLGYYNYSSSWQTISMSDSILFSNGHYLYSYHPEEEQLHYLQYNVNELFQTDDNAIWKVVDREVLLQSLDSARTWQTKYSGDYITPVTLLNRPEGGYLATFNRALVSSSDGLAWEEADKGIKGNILVSLGYYNDEYYTGSVTDWFRGELSRHNPLTQEWDRIYGTRITGRVWEMVSKPDYLYIHEERGFYRLDSSVLVNLSAGASSYINSICISSSGDLFMGNDDDGLMRSKNGGNSWHFLTNGIGPDYFYFTGETPSGMLLTRAWRNGHYKSDDGGNSWSEYEPYIPAVDQFSFGIDDTVFAATSSGVRMSPDAGESWITLSGGDVKDVLFHAKRRWLFAAAYNEGVFLSCDMGSTWTDINANNSFLKARDMLFVGDSILAVCTQYGGVYELNIPKATRKVPAPSEPGYYSRVFLYPNPANASINLLWNQTNWQNAKIEIFNLRGELIYELDVEDGDRTHLEVIRIRSFESGVYFLKLSDDNYQKIKKFTVIR